MSDLPATAKALNWKQAGIPFLACFAFALGVVKYNGVADWYLLAAAVPLLMWLFLARTFLLTEILVFLVPLSVPYTMGGSYVVGLPSEMLLTALSGYVILLLLLKPIFTRELLFHPLVVLLLCEFAWMFFCSLFSNDISIGLKRVLMRGMFLLIYLLFFAKHFIEKGPRYSTLFILYGAGLVIPVIVSMVFHSQHDFSQSTAYKMCLPFYTDHTVYGACIAFVLPLLIIMLPGKRTFHLDGAKFPGLLLLCALLVAAEILSFSRAAWVSIIAAGIFGLLLLFRVRFVSIVLFLVAAGCVTWFYSDEIYRNISMNDAVSTKGDLSEHLLSSANVQSDASNTERINRWICAWRMAEEKPIVGFGPGMYQFEYGRFQERGHMTRISTFSGNKGHAHSEYFTQLSETGFPGFFLFIAIVLSVIAYGMRTIYRERDPKLKLLLYGTVLGLITFYVHGIFNAFLDADKMAVLVFGSVAIIVAADIRQSRIVRAA